MSPTPVRHVFVYGTLRRGQQRDINRLQPAPRWLGKASVQGLMYQLGEYPGVVLGAAGLVHGEVYAISAELERQLDVIEEVGPAPGDEYVKCDAVVRLERGHGRQEDIVCLLYALAPGGSLGKAEITGGDWAEYLAALGG